MNNFKVLLFGTLLLFVSASCKKISNNGAVASEERSLSNFRTIASEISGDVFITQDSAFSVSVEAEGNVLEVLETTVDNDKKLHIRIKNGKFVTSKNVKVYISMPDISGLYLIGSGNMELMNAINSTRLNLELKGSGNMSLQQIVADSITASISGSGGISSLSGNVQKETISISGSGSLDFFDLKANNSKVKISGSGNAKIYVTDSLSVKISGSGSVYYQGNPIMDVSISGSGKLKHL